jgi:hypothetical protein
VAKTIDEIWESLHPTGESLYIRIDETHPLDLYIGIDMTGERLLILLSENEPPQYPQGQSITISVLKRNDGKWSVVFKLVRAELKKIFSQLCEDLIESSRECFDTAKGASFLLSRYMRWKKLLERGVINTLDETSLRGLVGELLFLEKLIPQYGQIKSIQSWLGPAGADQDFRLQEKWFEVKTIRPGAQSVSISSVEQLYLPGYSGELVVIFLDKASPNEHGCFNPLELANRLRGHLSSDKQALDLFDSILETFGFELMDEYKQFHFVQRGLRHYEIREDFPMIKRDDIHSGVLNVKYEISLSSLSSFEKPLSEDF